MNLFYNVFKAMLKEEATTALLNTYQIAIGSLTGYTAEIYQQFKVTDQLIEENKVRVMEHKDDDIATRIRRLMEDAFREVIKDEKVLEATLEVAVSGGLMHPGGMAMPHLDFKNTVESFAIEIKLNVPGRSPLWHRTILTVSRRGVFKPSNVILEWERSTFPRPDQTVTDDAPVLLLNAADMEMISTGNESIHHFAKLAIKAGWKTVQIHGTQLVLVK